MKNTYDQMTSDDFDRLLVQVIDADNAAPSDLLAVPGVAEILLEHYNNDVLEAWDAEQDDRDDEAEA